MTYRTRNIINPDAANAPTLRSAYWKSSTSSWVWTNYYGFYPTRFGRGSKVCHDRIGRRYQTNPLFIQDQSQVFWAPLKNYTDHEALIGTGLRRLQGGWTCASRPLGSPPGYSAVELDNQAAQLISAGLEGWSRFTPPRPNCSLGQTIAEASSIPKMLKSSSMFFANLWKSMGGKKRLKDTSKVVANEWLNNQFGWAPFLSDVRGFIKTTRSLSSEIARVRGENGKYRHIHGVVENTSQEETLSESSVNTYHFPYSLGAWNSTPVGTHKAVLKTVQKSWFEGEFRYYIPGFSKPGWRGDAAIAAHLYGLRITPSLLYELMPWSWLIDWFSNTGDQIRNWEAINLEGLHAKYACTMQTSDRRVDVDSTLNLAYGAGTKSCTFTEAYTVKRRSGCASPFGWNANYASLSNWQKSIMAALGLSRIKS